MAKTIKPGNLEALLAEVVTSSMGKPAKTGMLKSISAEAKRTFSRKNETFNTSVTQRKKDLADHMDKRRMVLREDSVPEPVDVEDGFVYGGRLIDERDRKPIPYARIRVMDLDRKEDDPLGIVTSDSSGNFSLFYTHEDFKDTDAVPEIYAEILDENDQVILRTKRSMIEKTPRNAWYEIAVDADKLPDSIKKTRGSLSRINKQQTKRLSRLTTVTILKKPIAVSSFTLAPGRSVTTGGKMITVPAVKKGIQKKGEKISLAHVAGLGKVSVEKLMDNRITTVKAFIKAPNQQISKILNISEERILALKENGKSLLK